MDTILFGNVNALLALEESDLQLEEREHLAG